MASQLIYMLASAHVGVILCRILFHSSRMDIAKQSNSGIITAVVKRINQITGNTAAKVCWFNAVCVLLR